MMVIISGILLIEGELNPKGAFYNKNSVSWKLPVPITLNGKEVGQLADIHRDPDAPEYLIADGFLDLNRVPVEFGWEPKFGTVILQSDSEAVVDGDITEVQIGYPVDPNFELNRFFV